MTCVHAHAIRNLFNQNVRGKKFESNGKGYDGEEGHWLERLMGIEANSDNAPDKYGYEQKKISKSKISLGDWSASWYMWHDGNMNRNEFIRTFGLCNKRKGDRFSWSGRASPTYGKWNQCGQRLFFEDGHLVADYCYAEDNRTDKNSLVPEHLHSGRHIIATWFKENLSEKVNNKFNQRGFYILTKDKDGVYNDILFGPHFGYDKFTDLMKSGEFFFDSGMYEGNSRNYSIFRGSVNMWLNMASHGGP